MKLYYAPNTRALRPRWLLEEAGLPYELVTVDMQKGEHRQPAHLKVHPLGAVPALEDEGVTLIESAAICLYLADKAADKRLAPPVGTPARGRYYQWMVYAMATLEPAVLDLARAKDDAAKQAATARCAEVARPVESALGDQFLLGADFTAADVMIGSIFGWGSRMGAFDPAQLPKIAAYTKRCVERPAFKKARS